MKVECIWLEGREAELTIGKEYEVLNKTNHMYLIANDLGEEILSIKNRFKVVEGK